MIQGSLAWLGGPELARVRGDGVQRLGGRAEEDGVDHGFVLRWMYEGRDVPCEVENIHKYPLSSTLMTGLSWASSVFLSSRMVGRGTIRLLWS